MSNATNFDRAYQESEAARAALPAWIKHWSEEGFAQFRNTGYPTIKDEEWKYTSLRELSKIEFHPAPQESVDLGKHLLANAINLVTINGHIDETILGEARKKTKISIRPLKEALAENSRDKFANFFGDDRGFLRSLNSAFLGSGFYIEVDKGVEEAAVINLVHVQTAASTANAVFLRNLFLLKANSKLKLMEQFVSEGEGKSPAFCNAVSQVQLEPGSGLEFYHHQGLSESVSLYQFTKCDLAAQSRLQYFCFDGGGKLVRNDVDVGLNQEGAEAQLNGLYLTRNQQHVDHHTAIVHNAEHTTSSQLYKGVLDHESHGVFNGKIVVKKPHSTARQQNRNLLVGAHAKVNTKPELLINNDEVKCSHGAAIGALDPDELFYLQSRGIVKEVAESMLAKAFMNEVFDQIPDQDVKRFFMAKV